MGFMKLIEGEIGLVQLTEDGRLAQIALTQEQRGMFTFFLSMLSQQKALIKLPEEYDLVSKSKICKKCQSKNEKVNKDRGNDIIYGDEANKI